MKTNKAIHTPSGLIVEMGLSDRSNSMFEYKGITGYALGEQFKPLSEFNKDDLRYGDYIHCENGLIFMFESGVNTPDWDGVQKVTRNNEVIYEREEKSEVQQIIDKLEGLVLVKPDEKLLEAIKLFDRLSEIEAKRSAE